MFNGQLQLDTSTLGFLAFSKGGFSSYFLRVVNAATIYTSQDPGGHTEPPIYSTSQHWMEIVKGFNFHFYFKISIMYSHFK